MERERRQRGITRKREKIDTNSIMSDDDHVSEVGKDIGGQKLLAKNHHISFLTRQSHHLVNFD
jgi:hypothetical protein